MHQDTCLYSFIGAVLHPHFASRSSYLAWLLSHLFGWCWWALGWEHDCFYSWAICFFFLGLRPIAFDSSTRFASAFHSASLHLVSRPTLPFQLKPPIGVHPFVPSIYSFGAPCQPFFYCHPWLLFRLVVSGGGCLLGCCHCMCSKWFAPTIDYWQPPLLNKLETVATIIDQRTSGAAPWMPINRGIH